ncbi:MAG: hypothetical protein WB526_12965 [Candidatus Cybelea sp.]
MGRQRFLRFAAILSLAAALDAAPAQRGSKDWSRVYVTAYGCEPNQSSFFTTAPTLPGVELYDQSETSKAGSSAVIRPTIHRTAGEEWGAVGFYFDMAPGYYELALSFSGRSPCGANGPLIVIPGATRNIVVFASNGITDWHARLALAGVMPVSYGIGIQAVLLDRPAKCGDDIAQYAIKETDGVVDAGVYYANLMAYDRQDHTIALILSGALFTRRAILLTVPLGGPKHARDLLIRSLDYDAVWKALQTTPAGRFTCINRF